MTVDVKAAPRRWKLPREFAEGESGRVERTAYQEWRTEQIKVETEDIGLRRRLLTEEAEALRDRAGARQMRALEKLTPRDHLERLQAKDRGESGAFPVDEQAAKWESQAAEMEAEAAEIAQFEAEHAPIETPAEHIERMRTNR